MAVASRGVAAAAPFFAGTVYGAAYFGGTPDSVLVIGLGGGPDIFTALHYRARPVTGEPGGTPAGGPHAGPDAAPHAAPDAKDEAPGLLC